VWLEASSVRPTPTNASAPEPLSHLSSWACGLAIALGPDAAALLATVPEAALGALLVFAALSLASTADLQTLTRLERRRDVAVVVLCVVWNSAFAFVTGQADWMLAVRGGARSDTI